MASLFILVRAFYLHTLYFQIVIYSDFFGDRAEAVSQKRKKKSKSRVYYYIRIIEEKSRSQSSTFGHIREKHAFLMGKFGIAIERLGLPMKLISVSKFGNSHSFGAKKNALRHIFLLL